MPIRTPLCDRLGLRHPIFLAPMAGGPSTPALAAAVTAAGGLGALGVAYLQPDALRREIRAVRAATAGPLAVNLFLPAPVPPADAAAVQRARGALQPWLDRFGAPAEPPAPPYAPDFDEQLGATLEEKPALVSFTFGVPPPAALDACRRAGVVTMGSATSVAEALALEAAGVDLVCAQSIEAGGHRGIFDDHADDTALGLFALVPLLVARLRVPVVAAGAVMTGAALVAARALGAQAVQMGTAFLACAEAGTSAPYRRALLSGDAQPATRFTRAFSGRPARGLDNAFMRELAADAVLPFPLQNQLTRGLRRACATAGSADALSLWAGQAAPLIRESPAADVVERVMREAEEALRSLG